MSPFEHGIAYADVLLPIAPFTETAGTFVNCEGRVQSFHGVVQPLGETRPGWKVLRVLGTLLGLPGFDADTVGATCATRCSATPATIAARLDNAHRALALARAGAPLRGGSSASPTCRSTSPTRSCAARRRCSRPRDAAPPARAMNALRSASSSGLRDGDAGAGDGRAAARRSLPRRGRRRACRTAASASPPRIPTTAALGGCSARSPSSACRAAEGRRVTLDCSRPGRRARAGVAGGLDARQDRRDRRAADPVRSRT